jgi:hypothetical protein
MGGRKGCLGSRVPSDRDAPRKPSGGPTGVLAISGELCRREPRSVNDRVEAV